MTRGSIKSPSTRKSRMMYAACILRVHEFSFLLSGVDRKTVILIILILILILIIIVVVDVVVVVDVGDDVGFSLMSAGIV